MISRIRRSSLAAWVVVSATSLLWLLAGCANESATAVPDGCGVSPAGELVLVVGVHRNQPAPDIPREEACSIEATLRAGNRVTVVALDGNPAVVFFKKVERANGLNELAFTDDINAAQNELLEAVRSATADDEGSDLMAAVRVAADQLRAGSVSGGRITVIDSGLPDRGPLNMTQKGMLGASPSDVADFLADNGQLPDLKGVEVRLVGVGYTADPQPPLDNGQRSAVTAILTAVMERAGSQVQSLPVPRTGEGPDTELKTGIVPVSSAPQFRPPDPGTTSSEVFDDTTALGFLPDSTQLRDPRAARTTLTGLAQWLASDRNRRVTITGTCASPGTKAGRARLSSARAQAIKSLLVDLGVYDEQVTTRGLGYTANPPDRRADGSLDPALAAQNRAVTLTTSQ